MREEEKDLFTPQELIEEFPDVANYGWDAAFIGRLFHTKFLHGPRKNGKTVIALKSILKLLEANKQLNVIEINRKNRRA